MKKPTVETFHRRLHSWYAQYGRKHLPWRNTSDPYAIYLSEVMLQQTQVKTVLERFYFPFLAKFPTLQALGKATPKEVLELWQGLGYYNRALNLHKAAQASAGGLPSSVEALMALPGIGMNTAHAVAAFAFRQPVAVMEANVKRVVSRIFAMAHPKDKDLWQAAAMLLDTKEPFDYNQAMMDLGSLVCTKHNPKCNECPAQPICKGQDSPESYPALKAKKAVRVRPRKIVVLRNRRNQYYSIPRAGRFLSGLYHFIETDMPATEIALAGKNYALADARLLGHVRQQYSHFILEAEIWLLENIETSGKHWYPAEALRKLPMSMAEQKILQFLEVKESAGARNNG